MESQLVFPKEKFEKISKELQEKDENILLNSARELKKILNPEGNFNKFKSIDIDPPIQEVIDAQCTPILLKLIKNTNINIQIEALSCIAYLLSGTTEQTSYLIQCGVIPILLDFLEEKEENLLEIVIWALGNIIGDSKHRTSLINKGVLDHFIRISKENHKLTIQRILFRAIYNSTKGGFSIHYKKPLIEIYQNYIHHQEKEVTYYLLWSIFYFLDHGNNERIQLIFDSGLLKYIISFLYSPKDDIVHPSLKIINIIIKNGSFRSKVMEYGILIPIKSLFNHQNILIRYEAYLSLNYITLSKNNIQYVLNLGFIPILFQILKNDKKEDIKLALKTLINLLGSEAQIIYILSFDLIQVLVMYLNDDYFTSICLKGLRELFNENIHERVKKDIYFEFCLKNGFETIFSLKEERLWIDDAIFVKNIKKDYMKNIKRIK